MPLSPKRNVRFQLIKLCLVTSFVHAGLGRFVDEIGINIDYPLKDFHAFAFGENRLQ